MTAREARNRRRAEERKARKLGKRRLVAECLATQQDEVGVDHSAGLALSAALGFVSQNRPTRAETNRANAQHSTGPRTPDGKLASSRNSFKHGLSTGQIIMPGEDPAAFEELRQSLMEEHQPASLTEELLVNEMAQSYWLEQRAIRLQNDCFTLEGIDETRLSLFLRYQTTYNRAFHKALNTLLKLQKDRNKAPNGFVSQSKYRRGQHNGFVSQNGASQDPEVGFVSQKPPAKPFSVPLLVAESRLSYCFPSASLYGW